MLSDGAQCCTKSRRQCLHVASDAEQLSAVNRQDTILSQQASVMTDVLYTPRLQEAAVHINPGSYSSVNALYTRTVVHCPAA